MERVGNVLNSCHRILFHVLYVRDGTVQATARDRIAGIYHHPTLEIYGVAVSVSGACADERNSIIRHVEHVDKTISVENASAR